METVNKYKFVPRSELSDYEWDYQKVEWNRINVDKEIIKELSKRKNLMSFLRIGFLLLVLIGTALAAIRVAKYNIFLAIPIVYVYYFFYGFLIAIGHELQHKIVFTKSLDWLSEIIFFIFECLMWNPPRYARISHRLHHRYTMVRGLDPETNWDEVITTKWLKNALKHALFSVLVFEAVINLYKAIVGLIKRVGGDIDDMIKSQCSEKDIKAIRRESFLILLVHFLIATTAIVFKRYELLVFITIAWQIGGVFEAMWHNTEHIGRMRNSKDQRICTRSIKVSPLIKFIYWGLDDHVDHHLFPSIPSSNLPKLHKIIKDQLPEPDNIFGCWAEMFAIGKEKDINPQNEFVGKAEKPIIEI